MSIFSIEARRHIQDWVNLVLAAVLIVSPWALGYDHDLNAARTAWVSGIVIGILAIAAIVKFAEWEEWVSFLFGAWLVAAPWVVNFAGDPSAMRAHVVLGVLVAVVSLWAIWTVHNPTASAPSR